MAGITGNHAMGNMPHQYHVAGIRRFIRSCPARTCPVDICLVTTTASALTAASFV